MKWQECTSKKALCPDLAVNLRVQSVVAHVVDRGTSTAVGNRDIEMLSTQFLSVSIIIFAISSLSLLLSVHRKIFLC